MSPPSSAGGTVEAVDPRVVRTRAAVVAAATELLAADGIGRLTIDAIAQRSGVARSTVYRNWPERADLLLAVFESVARVDCPLVALGCNGDHRDAGRCEAEPPTTVEDLRRVIDDHGHRLAGLPHSALGGALASIVAEAQCDQAIAVALNRFVRARRQALAETCRRVVAGLGADPQVECDQAVERFVSPFFYRYLISGEPVDESVIGRQAEMLLSELGLISNRPTPRSMV